MSRNLSCSIVSALALGFALSAHADLISQSSVIGPAGVFSDASTQGAPTQASSLDAAGVGAQARANVNTLGVSASTSGANQTSRAKARYIDLWSCTGCALPGGGIPPLPYQFKLALEGAIDPLLLNPALPVENMLMSFYADFIWGRALFNNGDAYHLHVEGGYDGGAGPLTAAVDVNGGPSANLNGNIQWGTNAAGQTTMQLHYVSPVLYWQPFLNRIDVDFVMHAEVDSYNGVSGGHFLDFFNTFSYGVVSLDPRLTLVSDGGAHSVFQPGTGSVPEPTPLWLLASGLVALVVARRRVSPRA